MGLFKNKKTVQSVIMYITSIILTDVKLKERRADIFKKPLLEQLKEVVNYLYFEIGVLRKAFDNACAETKTHLGRLECVEKEKELYKSQIEDCVFQRSEVERLKGLVERLELELSEVTQKFEEASAILDNETPVAVKTINERKKSCKRS